MAIDLTGADPATLALPAISRVRRVLAQVGITVLCVLTMTLLFTITTETVACTEAEPCVPMPSTMIAIGALAAACFAAWINPWAAAVGASLFAIGLLFPFQEGELPAYLLLAAWLGVIWFLAWLAERPSRSEERELWRSRVGQESTPRTADPLRMGRPVWQIMLLGTAIIFVGLGVWLTYEASQREAKASIISTTVRAHTADNGVQLVRPDGTDLTIQVLDQTNYPVDSTLRLRVDDKGLAQPVSEPYNATGWFLWAAIFGVPGIGVLMRNRQRERELKALLELPQPVTNVWYSATGHAIHPADVDRGDAPIAIVEKPQRLRLFTTDLAASPKEELRPAVLYGVAAIGSFCAVLPSDRHSLMVGRLRKAPPNRWLWPFDRSMTSDLRQVTEQSPAPEDRAPEDQAPQEVQVHRNAFVRVLTVIFLFVPVAAIGTMRMVDPPSPTAVWLTAAVTVAALLTVSWWVFIRPVTLWNRGGITIASVTGTHRFRWAEISRFESSWATVRIVAFDGRRAFVTTNETMFDLPVWHQLQRGGSDRYLDPPEVIGRQGSAISLVIMFAMFTAATALLS